MVPPTARVRVEGGGEGFAQPGTSSQARVYSPGSKIVDDQVTRAGLAV